MNFWKWCSLLPCGRQARCPRSPTWLTLHHHRVLVSRQTEYVGVGRRLTTTWKRILRAATVPPRPSEPRASPSFQVLAARRCYSPGGFPGNHHRGGEGDAAGCAEGGQLPTTRTPRRPGDSDIIKPNESGGNTKENILTIPNVLTVARMASAPVLGYLVLNKVFMCALGLFVCAGITDILDGYIARNYKNQKSAFGSALDPLADKFLISILMVTMMMVDLIPVPLIVLILSRDVLLIGAAFYVRYMSLPLPKTLKRYFDVRNATATLCPTTISKVNTAVQLSLITLSLAAPIFGYVDHPFLHFFWCMTAATTVASGMSYILARKNVVKILAQQLKK